MSCKWVEDTLENLSSSSEKSFAMGPFGSKIKRENYTTDGVPVLRGINLGDLHFYDEDYVFLTDEKANELKGSLAFPGDIVFVAQGTVGKVTMIPKESNYPKYVLSQNLMKFSPDNKKLLPKFVDYYFHTSEGQNEIFSRVNPTGVPCISQPLTSLKSFSIKFPELYIQEEIISILSSLDEKIAINKRINKNLEEFAQTLFKHWFIDFEFPNENGEPYKSSGGEFEESELGMLPKGWHVASLDELLEVNPKRKMKKGEQYPYVDMKSVQPHYARVSHNINRAFSSGSKFSNGDVLLARITPCLENGKTAYVDFLSDTEVGWGSTEFLVLRSRVGIPTEFCYFLARTEQFRSHAILSMTGSSGRQRVRESSLMTFQVPVPPEHKLFVRFGEIAKSAFDLMKKNDDETAKLIQIRDTLLPKLMSGEIQVPVDEA